MSLSEFKDFSAGLQSITIALITVFGGAWALFQFFSLRALDVARLNLDKAKRELVERSVLIIGLKTEAFELDASFFLHVRVDMQNVGNGVDVVDWTKASMFARRFEKVGDIQFKASDQLLPAWRASSFQITEMRFVPGFSTSESFLVAIPDAGVYYIEFAIETSPAVRAQTFHDIGVELNVRDAVVWRADTFVCVSSETSRSPSAA